MKICHTCKKDKPESEFGKNGRTRDGLQIACKVCKCSYDRVYHQQRSSEVKQRKVCLQSKRREKLQSQLDVYLRDKSCVNCGESNPHLLKFVHLKDKKFAIREAVMNGVTWNKIFQEINKCEIRCLTCCKSNSNKNSLLKKVEQLGEDPGKASHRLTRDILFKFIVESGHLCFRCGEKLTRETFSIEHKEPWLDSENPRELFFNLSNISFSHLKCNSAASRKLNKYVNPEEKRLAHNKREREKWVALPKEEQQKLRRKKYLSSGK